MDRFWHLTCTTYGTWLPGDERGSVTRVREGPEPRFEHDEPRTPYIGPASGLERSATEQLKRPPIFLNRGQAEAVANQFRETARHRGWTILACAVMCNHFHLLVGVPGDPDPDYLLGSFKAWASRRLNSKWGKPTSDTWWT